MYKVYKPFDPFTPYDANSILRQTRIPVANVGERNQIENPTEGMEIYRLDTHTVERHNGVRWSPTQDGVIPPATIIGGRADEAGTIIPADGIKTIRLDGIFSERWRVVEVAWTLHFSSPAGTSLRLTRDGAPVSSGYATYRITGENSAVTGTASTGDAWPAAGLIGNFLQGTWRFTNPAHFGPKYVNIHVQKAPGIAVASDDGWLGSQDAAKFDGIQIDVLGGHSISDSGASFLKVRGVA